MKKKLLITLAIVICIPLFMYINLFIYYMIFNDESDDIPSSKIEENNKSNYVADKEDNNLNDESDSDNEADEDNNSSDNNDDDDYDITVIVDTSKVTVKKIDNITYANAKQLIDSFASDDMENDIHYFNFERADRETLEMCLSRLDQDGNNYVDDEFTHLLDLDAFLVSSWFTDVPIYIMFVGSTEAVRLGDTVSMTDIPTEIITIDEAPRLVDGEIYISIDTFAKMTDSKVKIKN